MHFLQLYLDMAEKFSSELQISGLEELLVVQHAIIFLPLGGKGFGKILCRVNIG
jgi:hypothetical protein